MVDKLKTLYTIYARICCLNDEIKKIDDGIASLNQINVNLSSFDLDSELSSVKSKLNNKKISREILKNKHEAAFIKMMVENYGLNTQFDGKKIVIDSINVSDPNLEGYKKTLKSYTNLFNRNGINDAMVIAQLNMILYEIFDFYKVLELLYNSFAKSREENIDFISEKSLTAISKKMADYCDVLYLYQDFIHLLTEEEKNIISDSSIQYIIKNTFLLPLVYANNKDLIKGSSSLNRMFKCQFHHEKTPSMRVSLDKNYFNCFGCGKNGNQAEYLCQFHNISIEEGIFLLAEVFLMDIPNNPYKYGEKNKLVCKYRQVLLSDDFRQFLIETTNKLIQINPDNKLVFSKLLSSMDRIKFGEWDKEFCFEFKSKKYKNSKTYTQMVKKLVPSPRYLVNDLPF